MTIRIVLLVLALISFILAALGISPPRTNMLGAGLAFWVLGELLR